MFQVFTSSLNSPCPRPHTHTRARVRTHPAHPHLCPTHPEALLDIYQQCLHILQVFPGWVALEQHLLHQLSGTETHPDPQIPQLLLADPGPLLWGQEKSLKAATWASGPPPAGLTTPTPTCPCRGSRPQATSGLGQGQACLRVREKPQATGPAKSMWLSREAHEMSQEAGGPPRPRGDSHQPGDVGHSEHPLVRHADPVVDGEVVFLGR